MRSKRLFGNKVLYFQHSPPYTSLDTVSASKRLAPPFSDAPDYMCSPYFYWWAFMREWDAYTECCTNGGSGPLTKLYDDFGDLRGLKDEHFMDWWRDGGRLLFCEPEDQGVEFLPSAPVYHDDENRVLISVPVSGDLDRVLAEIRENLGKEMRRHREKGGADPNASRAKYKVIGSPRLSVLEKQLRIYRLREKYQTTTKVDLAYESGILKGDRSRINPDTVTAQISEYYKEACNIVENLVTRVFPVADKPLKNNDLFG